MQIPFYKYQGTGNDFVIIDNRQNMFDKNNTKHITSLCDRRFGIGADGLILLENHESCDFKMVYFNADGNESTMCGNGGRCITKFANYLGIIDHKATFEAIDGLHEAYIKDELVHLQMQDVLTIKKFESHVFLDTGSPHHVELITNLKDFDVITNGRRIRSSALYGATGSNVNFVTKNADDNFSVRTYERGVENETLSCGTGVTAVALAMNYIGETEKKLLSLHTPGGELQVAFEKRGEGYINVWLIGPAIQVFEGSI